jgi:hypothetical protein
MKAPKSNKLDKPQVLIPAGTHLAVLYSIVDLGTQENTFDPTNGPKRMVRLTWEFPKKRADFDGQSNPLVLSKELSFSMFEKATLRKIVEAMIGESLSDKAAYDFDFNKILGAGCLISVKHIKSKDGTKTYNSYSGCTPLMEGMTTPKPENKTTIYSVDEGESAVFASLPEWLQKKIQDSPEWSGEGAKEEEGDEIPF